MYSGLVVMSFAPELYAGRLSTSSSSKPMRIRSLRLLVER